jgi:hypothetical protein
VSTFSPTGSASSTSNTTGASSFSVTEIALPVTPGTEFTHVVAAGTKRFEISTKGTARFEIAATTASANTFKVKGGNCFRSGSLEITTSLTLFLTSPDSGDTIQIIEWLG